MHSRLHFPSYEVISIVDLSAIKINLMIGGRGGLISNVLVTGEAGVKLYRLRLTDTLPKLRRHHLVLA